MASHTRLHNGFTLIEMSIVLVIIGLIAGGILVGQELINGASVRAQISQFEKYNTAVNTFRNKYGFLPGDIPDPTASNFGFAARGSAGGTGDGNGLIQGYNAGAPSGNQQSGGETVMFWVDLSTANLIDGKFNTATSTTFPNITNTLVGSYFPAAKIGNGNFIYVYNGGYYNSGTSSWASDGFNYYGISQVTSSNTAIISTPGLSSTQAYNIDNKIDNGLPQSGNVQAFYLNDNICAQGAGWAAGGGVEGAGTHNPPTATTTSTAGSTTTCYDNNSTNGAQMTYSLSRGNALNCALSLRLQ